MWWFAVLSQSGEIAYMEYKDKRACELNQRNYARVAGVKTTTCIERVEVYQEGGHHAVQER